jgi:plasmid stabilization system protein ParE
VCEYPQSGAPLGGPNRRYLVQRFPYGLIYREEGDRIFILAVAHLRRRPEYWRGRE